MTQRFTKVLLMALFAALISAPAFAQSGVSSSIQGVVMDTGGGVIPGATVTATNESTAGKMSVVTAANGTFTVPALAVGSYTVTVELQGFKTAVLKGVRVISGAPASLQVKLEVGGVTEQIVVEGASSVIQTQSSASANTINTKQIGSLPLSSRDTLQFVTFLPGVNTPGGGRDSSINGLPQSSINITLDGVSVQDNYLKSSDGFFARMSPRLDAVEEVTVTTAGNGAEASSQGAIQIRFTTRSGSNVFSGSGYFYYQSDKLNTNTYFNKVNNQPKGTNLLYQPGARAGGPVYIPGLYDGRGKMFFFMNYEESRSPSTREDESDFLTPEARAGIFRYGTGGAQVVNLWTLAANTGNTTTPDPLIDKLLTDIENSTKQGGVINPLSGNFVAQRYRFQQPSNGLTRYPTVRVDYNLTSKHRLNFSSSQTRLNSSPDTTNTRQRFFPGFPIIGAQISNRYTHQLSVRSTITSNIVNEARYGMSGGPTQFSPGYEAGMWNGSLANQGGYSLGISAAGIRNAGATGGGSSRHAYTKFVDDTLNWLRGAHSLQMGATYFQGDVWLLTSTIAPTIGLGIVTGDPATNMFLAANFPGSSQGERNNAQGLYAVLTGRVNSIGGTGRLDPSTGKYVYNGTSRQEARLREYSGFIQDSWKIKPNLSLNFGMRYAYTLPISSNGSYSFATLDDIWGISGNKPGCDPSAPKQGECNIFMANPPTNGKIPTYQSLAKGAAPYNADTNNFAPSVGVNWTPSVESGFLRKILGNQGDTSFSGGWARSYERRDMSTFTGQLGSNPGLTTGATRNATNGNLGPLPLLLRQGSAALAGPALCAPNAITAACMQEAPNYPIPTTITGSVNIFDPNLQVPYAESWTLGMARALDSKSAFEVRYIGTRFREGWTTYDMNEVNIIENGFLNEFKLAQQNLYTNIAAGRGNTFAYFGAGTNTSPLPIYLAHFTGIGAASAGVTCNYFTGATGCPGGIPGTGGSGASSFANAGFYNNLSRFVPAVFTAAGQGTSSAATGLNSTAALRANAVAAGLQRNFWYANPDAIGGANVLGDGGYTKNKSFQLQYRRRLSAGLQFDANFSVSRTYESVRYSHRVDRKLTRDTGTVGDVSESFKATFVYELPFGGGKRWGSGVGPVMDRIIGGWQVSGTTRIQTGRLIDLGNVVVVGMTPQEAVSSFQLRKVDDKIMYMWPQDIIDNTIKAYSRDLTGYTQGAPTGRYFAPANGPDCLETISNGYGDCGVRSLVVMGPFYKNLDLSLVKDVRISGRKSFQFRFDFLNALDNLVFTPVTNIGGGNATTLSAFQLTGTQVSGRTGQLVFRFNW